MRAITRIEVGSETELLCDVFLPLYFTSGCVWHCRHQWLNLNSHTLFVSVKDRIDSVINIVLMKIKRCRWVCVRVRVEGRVRRSISVAQYANKEINIVFSVLGIHNF